MTKKAPIPGFSSHSRTTTSRWAQAKSAEETARKLGSDVEIVYADDDAVHQSTELLKVIQSRAESRPDAILVEPVGGMALPQVAGAAVAAGIGWAVLNRKPDYLPDLPQRRSQPLPSSPSVPGSHRNWPHAIKEDNSPPCCPQVVLFCTLKDLRTVPRPKSARPACWKRNRQTFKWCC